MSWFQILLSYSTILCHYGVEFQNSFGLIKKTHTMVGGLCKPNPVDRPQLKSACFQPLSL
jgi:hypothetical protein